MSTSGDDSGGIVSGGSLPFEHVQAAIDFAAAHPEQASNVCVAEGSSCGSTAAFPVAEGSELTMRAGVSVYGRYESTGWTRCSSGETKIIAGNTTGVLFDPGIQTATTLDGVTIERTTESGATAVTITGAHGAKLFNVNISGGAGAANTVGVDVTEGAEASIFVSFEPLVPGPILTTKGPSIGIRSVGSAVTLDGSRVFLGVDGSDAYGIVLEDSPGSSLRNLGVSVYSLPGAASLTGILVRGAGASLPMQGVNVNVDGNEGLEIPPNVTGVDISDTEQVTFTGNISAAGVNALGLRTAGASLVMQGTVVARGLGGDAHGIWLEDGPASQVNATVKASGKLAEGIHAVGDANGSAFSGGSVEVEASTDALGISLEACAGGSPLISEQSSILATVKKDGASAQAIRVAEDCHAHILSNQSIGVSGGDTNKPQELRAIVCADSCIIADNPDIHVTGSPKTRPGGSISSLGIGCGGACEITNNQVSGLDVTGCQSGCAYSGAGVTASGFISRNGISAGCAGSNGVGLSASGRVENNVIAGPSCGASGSNYPFSYSTGLKLTGVADVHSNTIFSGSVSDLFSPPDGYLGCWSTGVVFEGAGGAFRNNIMVGSSCPVSYAFAEASSGSAPDAFEHNDLFGAIPYYDDGDTALGMAEVNALPGASGNFSADPQFGLGFHLSGASPCIDAGAVTDAPATDFDGDLRDSLPDVGADEVTECEVNHGGCDVHSACFAFPGGHTCGPCTGGFTGDGASGCTDLDECALGTDDCAGGSSCVNAPGSFECECASGYAYTGTACADIDECLVLNGACGVASCINTDGGDSGCLDIDECETHNGDCDPLRYCVNEQGSHRCGTCVPGYSDEGPEGCVPIVCNDDHGGCDPLTTCRNTRDGAECGACPEGYAGDGYVGCTPIDHCEGVTCEHGGTCLQEPSGATACLCPAGITGPHCELRLSGLDGGETGFCAVASDHTLHCWGDETLEAAMPPGSFESVSVGGSCACAVRSDGGITCFGSCASPDPPDGTFAAVSCDFDQGCALGTDTRVTCFGIPEPDEGSFMRIAAGGKHGCGILLNGTLSCWGKEGETFEHGELTPPPGSFTAIDANSTETCAIDDAGQIHCWGLDSFGGAPLPAGAFQALAVADAYGCALGEDGTLACWGNNQFKRASPPAGQFKELGVSAYAACAVRSDDVIACWGVDASGYLQPPNGDFSALASPCGAYHCGLGSCQLGLALTCRCPVGLRHPTGELLACVPDPCHDNPLCDPQTYCLADDAGVAYCSACPSGYTGTGETGCALNDVCAIDHGGCDPLTTCTNVLGGRTCGACPAGYSGDGETGCVDDHPCATAHGGCDPLTVCYEIDGQASCGPCPGSCTGTGETGCAPVSGPGDPFVQVTAASAHACAVRSLGGLECWGLSDRYYATPPLCDDWVEVTARSDQTCGLRSDGTVECWGAISAFPPAGPFQTIGAGAFHTCGLKPDSTAECWGSDVNGSTLAPGGTFVSLSVGAYHACGLRSDQTLTCWGDDSFGQSSPPPGPFLSVSSGDVQTCGLHLDGSIECWGREDLQGWEPPTPGTYIAVGAATYSACGQNVDRTLTCWGNTIEPPPEVPFKSFSLGDHVSCGIDDEDVLRCWGWNDYGQADPPLL